MFRWVVFLLKLLCDDDISPFIDVLGQFWIFDDDWWRRWCRITDDRFQLCYCKRYYLIRSVFSLILHRYIIRLSLSSSRSCLLPCQCLQSLRVLRFQLMNRLPCRRSRPWRLIGLLLAIAPLAPLLFFLPVTLSETLSIWGLASHPGRAEGTPVIHVDCIETMYRKPKISPRLRVSHGMMRSLFHRTPTADPRPLILKLRLVDPLAVTLPLHSTSMDETSGVQVPHGT